ncbi:acyloxyacyl hydrolase, partial [Bacteroides ovatus]
MIRNRNAIRLLCLFCLLVYPAINANLEAQTIIGQRNDSVSHSLIRHQLGFDIRPGYIVSTHSFLQGDNARQKKIDQSLSFHFKYAFRFSKESNLGRLFPHTYQG